MTQAGAQPQAQAPAPTTRLPTRRTLRALVLFNALCLLAGLIGTRIVPRPVTLTGPGELAAEIPALQAFVERTRGRRFHYHVPIERSEQLRASSRSDDPPDEKEREAARLESAVLMTLGLVDKPFDPFAAQSSLDSQVLGVYDPTDRKLLVRPGPITPFARTVLVHELTHALDDEYHELRRSQALSIDESDMSFRALAEGSASYVETAYIQSLPPDERKAANDESKAAPAPPSTVPRILLVLAYYPYQVGEQFVGALLKLRGPGALDKAFGNPPTTSEQLFHVEKYLLEEEAATVPRPTPAGDIVQRGALGELLLRLMLAGPAGEFAARDAAEGWGGGRYVAWRQGADVCMRANLVMDTDKDKDEAIAALDKWAAARPRARITPGNVIGIENCVPR